MIFEKDVDSFLLRYLLNELAPEDREKVEEWMAANEKNRQYYRAYQNSSGVAMDGAVEKD